MPGSFRNEGDLGTVMSRRESEEILGGGQRGGKLGRGPWQAAWAGGLPGQGCHRASSGGDLGY